MTPKNSKNKEVRNLRHQMEYLDFISWIATPSALRSPKTQQELSKEFGVGQDTLSEWKRRPGFWNEVDEKRKQWGRERTPDVIMALYGRIIKSGDPVGTKLWFQYFENWSEKIIAPEVPARRYQHLTNAELAGLRNKLKNYLLKK